MSVDLTDVITDSISDATLPDEPTTDVEATPDPTPVEPVEAAPETTEAPTEPTPKEAPTPDATKDDKPEADDFAKKYGIPAESFPGRENRIPYGRVKKIVAKAVAEREAELTKSFTPKEAQLTELSTKVKDYDQLVADKTQFEDLLGNKPDQFLDLLSNIPAYKPFFDAVRQAFEVAQAHSLTQADPNQPVPDTMPQPNQKLSDGSMVYDMDGLKALLAWQAKDVETKLTRQFETRAQALEERYKPIETRFQSEAYREKLIPQVQAQIQEARQWPLFSDNELAIVKYLQTYPKADLRAAYQAVVWPKLTTDRNKLREEILAEIKAAPTSTSAPTRATKPSTQSSGPKSLETIISESIQSLK